MLVQAFRPAAAALRYPGAVMAAGPGGRRNGPRRPAYKPYISHWHRRQQQGW